MSFEHKEYIEMFLGVHDEDAQKELERVYAMAEAFEEMAEALPDYRELVLSKTGMRSTYDYMAFGNFALEVILNCESEE